MYQEGNNEEGRLHDLMFNFLPARRLIGLYLHPANDRGKGVTMCTRRDEEKVVKVWLQEKLRRRWWSMVSGCGVGVDLVLTASWPGSPEASHLLPSAREEEERKVS